MGRKPEGKHPLVWLCQSLGMSQNQLAARLGCHHNTIQRICTGEKELPPRLAGQIEDLFSVDAEWLLGKIKGRAPLLVDGRRMTKTLAKVIKNQEELPSKGRKLAQRYMKRANEEGLTIGLAGKPVPPTMRHAERARRSLQLTRLSGKLVITKQDKPKGTEISKKPAKPIKQELKQEVWVVARCSAVRTRWATIFERFCRVLVVAYGQGTTESRLLAIDRALDRMIAHQKFKLPDKLTGENLKSLRRLLLTMNQIEKGKWQVNPEFGNNPELLRD